MMNIFTTKEIEEALKIKRKQFEASTSVEIDLGYPVLDINRDTGKITEITWQESPFN